MKLLDIVKDRPRTQLEVWEYWRNHIETLFLQSMTSRRIIHVKQLPGDENVSTPKTN